MDSPCGKRRRHEEASDLELAPLWGRMNAGYVKPRRRYGTVRLAFGVTGTIIAVRWTDILQGLGGLAGVIALGWQIANELRRRAKGPPPPPELRNALLEVLPAAETLARTPQNHDWMTQTVGPPLDRINTLVHTLPFGSPLFSKCSLAVIHLQKADVLARYDGDTRPAEEIALRMADQREAGRKAEAAIRDALDLIARHSF
ncbi:MAG: hypothetical protein QOC82_1547 [Frankiaceae bacterium]|jgi:hypothetical protein|nr:hypothetical protein [Frankiaceae bacterium]